MAPAETLDQTGILKSYRWQRIAKAVVGAAHHFERGQTNHETP